MEMKRVGIDQWSASRSLPATGSDAGELEGWPVVGGTGSWRSRVVKARLREIVNKCSTVTLVTRENTSSWQACVFSHSLFLPNSA